MNTQDETFAKANEAITGGNAIDAGALPPTDKAVDGDEQVHDESGLPGLPLEEVSFTEQDADEQVHSEKVASAQSDSSGLPVGEQDIDDLVHPAIEPERQQ